MLECIIYIVTMGLCFEENWLSMDLHMSICLSMCKCKLAHERVC